MDQSIQTNIAEPGQIKIELFPMPPRSSNSKVDNGPLLALCPPLLPAKPSYADLEKELASTRKNLASNVTLLEEANQALSTQKGELENLERKHEQALKEKQALEIELLLTTRNMRLSISQLKAEKRKRKEAQQELEELKKKKFKFTFEAGIGDAE
ncbi:hypothetical protein JCM3765_000031 [Sporobolomyces pararoseus]